MPRRARQLPTARDDLARPGAAPSSVLVIESHELVLSNLATGLAKEGLVVQVARDGRNGIAAHESMRPQPAIVLVDLVLTGMSGLDVCRRLRATSQVPIIVMSARASEIDAVVALELGADDCVLRSCRLPELAARIRAALRRAPREDAGPPGTVSVGDVSLDSDRCEVIVRGTKLRLPRKEFQVLRVLLEHPGRVFSRDALIRRVWGDDYVGDTKTLDVHVRRLRTKLEEDPTAPRRLRTVRGLGFKFDAVDEASPQGYAQRVEGTAPAGTAS